jgi:hypothetical protein
MIAIDVTNANNSNINSDELVANGNNPQNGALVAQTFMDANLNSTVDKDAVSGYAPRSPTSCRLPLSSPPLLYRTNYSSTNLPSVRSGSFQPAKRSAKAIS